MTNTSRGDIGAYLKNMSHMSLTGRCPRPLIGVDECLNHPKIITLTRTLIERNLSDGSTPLWVELREKDGVLTGSFLGGTSKTKQPNPFIHDIGTPVKHFSCDDYHVAQMLVLQFVGIYDKVVLLSENTLNNKDGLRKLLKEVVEPALVGHHNNLSLTALFKKGKTSIDDYCTDVIAYFKRGNYLPGYHEVLL